tara:strand:- start:157 stop:423 length:267 start_codon:yes stop_codon:yes gene_type:complete
MSCKKFSFNNIANVISIVSGVSLAGIIGAGTFVYVNKDAIIDNVKQQAIEAVMGSMGGGLGGSLPTGSNDLSAPDNSASIPSSGIPNF